MNLDPTEPVLFRAIRHNRTADEVIGQIEILLLEGVLSAGEKLPGERELAEQFCVSRPILREALKALEARGLLVSRHGGGTFVADLIGQVFSTPLAELVGRHDRATADYLEFRREIEGHAASLAALRATPSDHAVLDAILARMDEEHAVGGFEQELDVDIELHHAIGDAAHNIILMHTLNACYRMLAEGIFHHRNLILGLPGVRQDLLNQHRAIVAAIKAGDPAAARKAAEDHIDYVARAAERARTMDARAEISDLKRLRRLADQNRPSR